MAPSPTPPPPARLSALAGQDRAVERLSAAIGRGRLHHALLLSGPEGVGKYLGARLLARILLCTARDPHSAESCGRCGSCLKHEEAGHADVIILERPADKTTILVDDLRECIRLLHLRPTEGVRRVLIVRDAHEMNPAGQNALLKTLEEPPGDAQIILTTHKPEMLLPTVRSRCATVHFAPVPRAALALLVAERHRVDPARASLIAGLAAGSPGLAVALDPDVLVALRDRAAAADARLVAGKPGAVADALAVAASLGDKDAPEPRDVLDHLRVWLRDQLLVASGAPADQIASDDRLPELRALAESRGIYEILRRARMVEEAQYAFAQPYNYNAAMTVEQLCLRLVGHGVAIPAA